MASRLETLIRKRGLLTQREAAEHLAGEPIRGSWWGHPASKQIYTELMTLEDARELALFKLVEGKLTYVHERLWPALVRVQRETALWPALSPAAKRLLRELAEDATVRITGDAKSRVELESTLRVIGRSVHTPAGHHEALLEPFDKWVTPALARSAERLSLDAALAALASAGWQPEQPRRPSPTAQPRSRRC